MKVPTLFRACAAAALLAFAAAPALPAAELTLELMADLKMVEDAQLSPDGTWVTYLVADETARDGKPRSIELWIATASGELSQRRLLPANFRATEARWSPRENLLAIAMTNESAPRQRQLVLVDPQGKTTRVLAENFSGTSFTWTPDGRGIGYLGREPGQSAPKAKASGPRILGAPGGVGGATRLHVLDVASGQSRAVTPATHSIAKFAWSPRADAIVALATPTESSAERAVMIFSVANPGEAPRTLFVPHDQTNGLAWSPDGKTIAWTGREFTPDSGQIQLMAVTGEKAPRTVQADFPGSVHNILYRPDGGWSSVRSRTSAPASIRSRPTAPICARIIRRKVSRRVRSGSARSRSSRSVSTPTVRGWPR